jgi:hypothetical protein
LRRIGTFEGGNPVLTKLSCNWLQVLQLALTSCSI